MSEATQNFTGMAFSNAIADAVERAGIVTVQVNARRRFPLSGILFQPDLILTANHGVEREEDIQIGLSDGSSVEAALAGRDPGTDLALLRLKTPLALTAGKISTVAPRVGHLVVAVGRPMRNGVQASLGMITGLAGGLRARRGERLDRYLVTDAVAYPGFSGGPLVDMAGELIGVNTSGLVRGASLAVPIADAWRTAQTLAEHGHMRRGFLGIRSQGVEIPEAVRGSLASPEQTSGLLIVGVESGGPSAAGEMMVGDILVAVNQQPVTSHEDLMGVLQGEEVGQSIAVHVLRGGVLKTLTLVVGEQPSY